MHVSGVKCSDGNVAAKICKRFRRKSEIPCPVALSDLTIPAENKNLRCIRHFLSCGTFGRERRKKRNGTMGNSHQFACTTLEAANYSRETKVSALGRNIARSFRKPGHNSCLPRRNRSLAISRSSLFVNFSSYVYVCGTQLRLYL